MAAIYGEEAAKRRVIGLVFTTSSPVLAPPNGLTPVVGNNPICVAVPRRSAPPIVLDMALSEAAFGNIRLAAIEGREIPMGWAYDATGTPTSDAKQAVAAHHLVPIGRHKGYGLALVGEVLAGVMTASPFGMRSSAHGGDGEGVGHLVIAIDPRHWGGGLAFDRGVEELVAMVKASGSTDHTGARLPGEIEWRIFQERTRNGVPVSAALLRELSRLAEELGVRGVGKGKRGGQATPTNARTRSGKPPATTSRTRGRTLE
jgi:LDH2 family malate/lactate/ureidoglycolate dehydrogenase